jgi:nucleoside-diphosphate-sugar epimerase
MRVFLTGGTGLVGSHSAARFVQDGHEVVALCRAGADVAFLEGLGCALMEGDLRDDPAVLAPRMEGCTHLVHAAALVYSGRDWASVHAVNTQGTRNAILAAAEGGVGHVVHVSSVAVYGGAIGPIDEETPVDSELSARNYYGRSKRDAEGEARSLEEDREIPVTILRPASVYGERDRLLSLRIARMVRQPVAFLLGGGQNTVPAVYAGNVAEAVLLACEAGRGGTTYDVGMDYPLTQRGLVGGIAKGMGLSPKLVSVPGVLARGGAAVLERLRIPVPGARQLPLGRVVRLALGDNPYRSRRIREELGWMPPHQHHDALRRTGEWLIGAM